mmetsp:Transcript_16053/g.24189  ORF Transcript_16053/g.24189 Transcript_16053/m.24189 type:complete len:568 (-) Transcript_16053:24-1727(-)
MASSQPSSELAGSLEYVKSDVKIASLAENKENQRKRPNSQPLTSSSSTSHNGSRKRSTPPSSSPRSKSKKRKFKSPGSSLESGCGLCRRPKSDENKLGELIRCGRVWVHEVCIRNSPCFTNYDNKPKHKRMGRIDEELWHIARREVNRGQKLSCSYCKKKGATYGCAHPKCRKNYHLPCAIEAGCRASNNFPLLWTFVCEKEDSQHRAAVERWGSKKEILSDLILHSKIRNPFTPGTRVIICKGKFQGREGRINGPSSLYPERTSVELVDESDSNNNKSLAFREKYLEIFVNKEQQNRYQPKSTNVIETTSSRQEASNHSTKNTASSVSDEKISHSNKSVEKNGSSAPSVSAKSSLSRSVPLDDLGRVGRHCRQSPSLPSNSKNDGEPSKAMSTVDAGSLVKNQSVIIMVGQHAGTKAKYICPSRKVDGWACVKVKIGDTEKKMAYSYRALQLESKTGKKKRKSGNDNKLKTTKVQLTSDKKILSVNPKSKQRSKSLLNCALERIDSNVDMKRLISFLEGLGLDEDLEFLQFIQISDLTPVFGSKLSLVILQHLNTVARSAKSRRVL